MNSDEWDEITVAILACWPNKEIPERSFDLWFRDLSEFEAEQVKAAVLALYRDGREWAPNGAQIRNKLIELRTDSEGWASAYALTMEAATSHGGAEYGGLTWLREQDPVAADVAEAYGWRDFCLSDRTADGTRRAQFREMWQLRAAKADERERYRGLPSAGLKTLEQANSPRKLGEVIQLPRPDHEQGHVA